MVLLLFFDGDCGFCSKSVRKVYRLDAKGAVNFAPLQGKLSHELGFERYAAKDGGTMVIVRESDGRKFFKGDAWIELGKALGGIWALAAVLFSAFPKTVRDWMYDLVAKNRYLIAGKGGTCGLPEEGLRQRMRD